jgi:glycerol kinase
MSDSQHIVVIDQGSTSTKGALYSSAGERLRTASVAVERSVDGVRVEHQPLALAAGVERVLDQLAEGVELAAVGLGCQRSTCLVWERESGQPLTPALSWQDRSQADRVEALAGHAPEIARRTGLRLSPHYAAPKLAALLETVPDGLRRAADGELVAGTLDAFLTRRLTGRESTEPGHAGRSLLYDLEGDRWDPRLCDLFGVPIAALPALRPSAGSRGEAHGAPLVALAGDQQAALIGHGGWRTGVTAAHFGTGAFVLAATGDELRRHPGLLSAALASTPAGRRLQLEGSVNSAGSAVDWACRMTGERLEDWAERPLGPEGPPWVLPAFAGLGAPWWRHRARATVAGLSLDNDGADLLAAVLRGVAMRVLDCAEALSEAGVEIEVLRLSGKLTRLSGLVDLLADAGGLPVEVSAEEETGLDGLFRLSALGLGRPGPIEEAPKTRRRREPAWPADRTRTLRHRWRRFVEESVELREA